MHRRGQYSSGNIMRMNRVSCKDASTHVAYSWSQSFEKEKVFWRIADSRCVFETGKASRRGPSVTVVRPKLLSSSSSVDQPRD
jgi:hypothetical protein